jgi:hypothetical protein
VTEGEDGLSRRRKEDGRELTMKYRSASPQKEERKKRKRTSTPRLYAQNTSTVASLGDSNLVFVLPPPGRPSSAATTTLATSISTVEKKYSNNRGGEAQGLPKRLPGTGEPQGEVVVEEKRESPQSEGSGEDAGDDDSTWKHSIWAASRAEREEGLLGQARRWERVGRVSGEEGGEGEESRDEAAEEENDGEEGEVGGVSK